jgi:hypothetical protein
MKFAPTALFSIFFAIMTVSAFGQRTPFPFPTQTPTPRPTPSRSPTPTPEPRTAACPRVTVQPQSAKLVRDGQPATFGANINGGDPKVVPTLLWSTSSGYIKDGQGTRRIEVDTTGAGADPERQLSATLWVGGYAAECFIQESASIKIIAPAVKFGEFGELPQKSVTENLQAIASYVANSTDNIYLFAYAGRKSPRGFSMDRIRKMKEDLVIAGLSPRRVIAMDGGYREEATFEFWVVPVGAEAPRPQPTLRRDEVEVQQARPPTRRPGT